MKPVDINSNTYSDFIKEKEEKDSKFNPILFVVSGVAYFIWEWRGEGGQSAKLPYPCISKTRNGMTMKLGTH